METIALEKDQWINNNYSKLRKDFEDELVHEWGYLRFVAENCNDWRDEFVDKEYGQYVIECENIEKEYMRRKWLKLWDMIHANHVHVNWSDNPLYI